MNNAEKEMPAPSLRLERTFEATPEQLWDAWTKPDLYARWLNPSGLPLVIHEWDMRPGGTVRFDMPQPDGNANPQSGVFHELEPPRRLVTGEPDRSFLMTVTFHPEGARTRMVVDVVGLPPEYHAMAKEGWGRSFDHLARLLSETRGA